MKTTLRFLALAAIVMIPCQRLLAQTSTNSEIEVIRKEMQQLREDYERRIQQLENRLQQVEKTAPAAVPPKPAEAPPPVVTVTSTNAAATNAAVAAESARQFAEDQFRRDTETQEGAMARARAGYLKKQVEKVLQDFIEIGGYVRAGYGRDNQGGPQVAFQAPGALSKYRLGNEAENYGELMFAKSWYVPGTFAMDAKERHDGTPAGPIAHAQVRLAFYDPYSNYNEAGGTQFTFPEAWAAVGNVWAAQPSMKFWAGDRFYRRQDIYISDFFFYNMSGGGGGVEDIQLPFGKMALAWIGNGSQSDLYTDIPSPTPANKAGFSKANWDLRLYDVPVPLGKGEFGLVFATADAGYDSMGNSVSGSDGVAFTFLHTRDKFLDDLGVNKLSLQVGYGAAKTFTSGFETFTQNGTTYIRPDPTDSWRFRFTEHFVVQPTEHFSIGPALVYQYTDYGGKVGVQNWFSTGVRPIVSFNKYISLAFEGGVDYVNTTVTKQSGALYKLSLAPQVSLGNQFFSRPVIRAYVTYAGWANAFKGEVGGNDYMNQTQGWSWGVQMESWW